MLIPLTNKAYLKLTGTKVSEDFAHQRMNLRAKKSEKIVGAKTFDHTCTIK